MVTRPDTDRDKAIEDHADETFPDAGQDHDADGGSSASSFAGTALTVLMLVIVIFGLSLWLVPMAAPHLPTSIARHIMPGQQELDGRIAALEALARDSEANALREVEGLRRAVDALANRTDAAESTANAAAATAAEARTSAEASAQAAASATVAERVVAAAEEAARVAAETAETATTAATEAGKVAAAATRDTAALARQLTSFEARLGALNAELTGLRETLTALVDVGDGGVSPTELSAAVAALQSQVAGIAADLGEAGRYVTRDDAEKFTTQDDLRSARTALAAEIETGFGALPPADTIVTTDRLTAERGEIEAALAAVRDEVSDVAQSAEAAVAAATAAQASSAASSTEVGNAIKAASMRAAAAAAVSEMTNGAAFATSLATLVDLSGMAAPEAVAAAAPEGVATIAALRAGFPATAQAAIAADLEAQSGGGIVGSTVAKFQSFIAGRPKDAVEGDTTEAVLSRVEARLADGALIEAVQEAAGLSPDARAAMSGWLGDLETRVTVEQDLRSYIDGVGAVQG